MFENFSQMAEQMATGLSRRQFLGRAGQGALVLAAALGGFLAFPTGARAARKCSSDADCRRGQVCRSGHCVNPPLACGPSSSLSCQGLNAGDGCIDGDFTGSCTAPKGSDSCQCG
jgi:hypothetical protein